MLNFTSSQQIRLEEKLYMNFQCFQALCLCQEAHQNHSSFVSHMKNISRNKCTYTKISNYHSFATSKHGEISPHCRIPYFGSLFQERLLFPIFWKRQQQLKATRDNFIQRAFSVPRFTHFLLFMYSLVSVLMCTCTFL